MGGFKKGSRHIYYYAGVWTGVDYRTLRSRHFETYLAAEQWLAKAA
jgi:hypothetical protein